MLIDKKQPNYLLLESEFGVQTTSNQLMVINKIIMICICIWMTWPYVNYKLGIYPFLVFFASWLLTTDYRWIFKGLSVDLLMFLCWLITFVPYILAGNFRYGAIPEKNVLISFLLFFCGLFINYYYMYYNKNVRALGKIAFFTLIFYFVASLQSFIGLRIYPLAARNLATGTDPLQQVYMSLGIGGFGYVYSAVFINITILYFIIKSTGINKSYIFFAVTVFFINMIMLISASYATSLLLIFTGTLLVFLIRGKRSLFFGVVCTVIFLILFPKEIIGYFLIDVSHLFGTNGVISTKFLDLAQGFVSESVGSQTSTRGQLYLDSLNTFLKSPLFGIYGPFGNSLSSIVGGHSGWIDLLAYYGLFGSLPLFGAIFLNFRKHIKFYTNHPYQRFLITAQILFVIYGFINPVIYIYQLGFVMFIIAPSLPFLPYAFSKKANQERN
jgi:hypothetical protein